MNLANKLTISRFFMIPIMLLMTVEIMPWQSGNFSLLNISISQLIFSILFLIAAFTDFLDGYIARKTNTITTFGKFLDPIADKALVITAMIYLVASGDFSVWVVSIVVLREFIVSGLRLVAVEKNHVISAGNLGKQKTLWTMVALVYYLFNLQQFSEIFGTALIWMFVLLTIISGYDYVYKNRSLLSDFK